MLKPLSLSALKPISQSNQTAQEVKKDVLTIPANTSTPNLNTLSAIPAAANRLPVQETTKINNNNQQQAGKSEQSTISTISEAEANKVDSVILANIAELEAKMIDSNPEIKTNLIIIHRTLAKDPALVTILTTEQRRIIFQGYKKQAGIEIVAANSKKRAASGSVKKNSDGSINLDEFM